MNAELRIGVITRTHGIRGEVKVYPTTDSPERFEDLTQVTLHMGARKQVLKIESVRYFKNLVILKFEGIDSINDVQMLKGAELYIPREEGEPLAENEYYIADILGMEVVTDAGELLGTVRDVLQNGANDVYVVNRGAGQKDLLLPAIRQCVLGVDIAQNRMTVHVMDGLLDL